MKIGDAIRHKNITGEAVVISSTVHSFWDDIKQKIVVSTEYEARYDDGRLIKFKGYNIGKTIFNSDGQQLSIFDYLK